ncbi:MAG: type I restriction endonuclease subunit R [Lewinellaceae bacterium]|nr:type I restriction endonuclease subunit R [Lewinellaceae bacterium]
MGWQYLSPDVVERIRGGNQSKVILESVLRDWLRANNQINFHGTTHSFSDTNIASAIEQLQNIHFVDGSRVANEKAYDLLTIGTSLEQRIDGDKKSFNLKYIDWQTPENNVYHVTSEFPVLREERTDTYRPDIVLFVNGIPLSVIENKRPDLQVNKGTSVDLAIQQQLRNQNIDGGIPRLFLYAQILLAVDGSTGKYATADTAQQFWSVWKEKYPSDRDEREDEKKLYEIKNTINPAVWDQVFTGDFSYSRTHFEALYSHPIAVTGQDRLIYQMLRPDRLMELIYRFIVFDEGTKKVARYQQYFAVQQTLSRVRQRDAGKRQGGVVWHTQGSGKSLTMVMLAKALILAPDIQNPRVIIVTDRIDLDDQITKTFKNCGKETYQARSGNHLSKLLREKKAQIITTIIDKFYKPQEDGFIEDSSEVFVLVDESHRSQYGEANVKMEQVLPNACFIGFTGTPLMKKERSTAAKYGGYIDKYTIDQAVEDGAVVPLLYEGRELPLFVNRKPIDNYFELISRDLNEKEKADLKKRFARADQISEAEQRLQMIAIDVGRHFKKTWQGTGFKGQLTAPSKDAAIRLHRFFQENGDVTTEVVISPPDTREGVEEPQHAADSIVMQFWDGMMKRFGNADRYQKQIIDQFKNGDTPEIIIVVDKLLTGFDAPKNTVLYMARKLQEHNLLQAIARVNRVSAGKEFGYIIDYHGLLGELDAALTTYTSLSEFEEDDLEGAVVSVLEELTKIKQVHSDLWSLFNGVRNKLDNEAMEVHLQNDDRRDEFYELHSRFARLLKMAISTIKWVESTPLDQQETYRKDFKYFTELRRHVTRRFSDVIDYGKYEKQIQRLINQHVSAGEAEVRVELVDIRNKEAFEAEVEKTIGSRAKADMIASRTSKYISEKMKEDPAFFKKLSDMLQDIVDEMHRRWDQMSESAKKMYLDKLKEVMDDALSRKEGELPDELIDEPLAKAIYHMLLDKSGTGESGETAEVPSLDWLVEVSNAIYQSIMKNKKVDWKKRYDVQDEMKREIDDVLYVHRSHYGAIKLDEITVVEESLQLAIRNLLP